MTAGILAMILAIGMTACTKADNTTKTTETSYGYETAVTDGNGNVTT